MKNFGNDKIHTFRIMVLYWIQTLIFMIVSYKKLVKIS